MSKPAKQCEFCRNGYPCHAGACCLIDGEYACASCREDVLLDDPDARVENLKRQP